MRNKGGNEAKAVFVPSRFVCLLLRTLQYNLVDEVHIKKNTHKQNMPFTSSTNGQMIFQYHYYNFTSLTWSMGKGYFSKKSILKSVPSVQKSNCRTRAEMSARPLNDLKTRLATNVIMVALETNVRRIYYMTPNALSYLANLTLVRRLYKLNYMQLSRSLCFKFLLQTIFHELYV